MGLDHPEISPVDAMQQHQPLSCKNTGSGRYIFM